MAEKKETKAKAEEKEKTPMEKLVEATGATRDELIDRAVVASLTQKWVPDGEK